MELVVCRNVDGGIAVSNDKSIRHIFLSDLDNDILVTNRERTIKHASDVVVDQGIALDMKNMAKGKSSKKSKSTASTSRGKGKVKLQ